MMGWSFQKCAQFTLTHSEYSSKKMQPNKSLVFQLLQHHDAFFPGREYISLTPTDSSNHTKCQEVLPKWFLKSKCHNAEN